MKYINNLKPKCSAGHDGISSKLLKDIAQIIAPTLTIIINQSLYTGIFPEKLKNRQSNPIIQTWRKKHLMENYRPISLLASISKIFERVVFNQIYQYFVEIINFLTVKMALGNTTSRSLPPWNELIE